MTFLPFAPVMYCFSYKTSCLVSKIYCAIHNFLNLAVPLGNLFGSAFRIIRTEQFLKEVPNKLSLGVSRRVMDLIIRRPVIDVTAQASNN